MTDQHSKPAVQTLTDDHVSQLSAQREWVAGHFDNATLYQDTSNKLRVVATVLESNWVDPSETVKLQCLGVALGDALAETVGLDWVTFSLEVDEWPGLRLEKTSLFIHPLTMISKRVEAGEDVDVVELFQELAHQIEELKGQVD
ncbi:MAG: DUF3806 domain-containing protein [Pseudomonadota bacterium]